MNICNCVNKKPEKFTNKFRAVQVDNDGICLNCGNYTLFTDNPKYQLSKKRRTLNKEKLKQIECYLKLGLPVTEIAEIVDLSRVTINRVKKQSYVKLHEERMGDF